MQGPKWQFLLIFIHMLTLCGHWDKFVLWVELPVQMRLCPIFVSGVGLPAFTSIPRVDGLSKDPRVLGRYSMVSEHRYTTT